MVLGGGYFLMSEVSLYGGLDERCGGTVWMEGVGLWMEGVVGFNFLELIHSWIDN